MYVRHNKDLNEALASSMILNRKGFNKLLLLGLFDILVTLPLVIIDLVQGVLQDDVAYFWPGWKAVHIEFSTINTITADEWKTFGFWTIFGVKCDEWNSLVLAFGFFILFGLTEQKQAWYRSIFRGFIGLFGYKSRVDPVASTIVFSHGPFANSVADDTHVTRR